MRTVAIMQPYWFPYLGYFQLATHVDTYVIYDRVEYTKRGWFNRNRILANGDSRTVTLPLARAKDDACVSERQLAVGFPANRHQILNVLQNSYRNAPHFKSTMTLVESTLVAAAFDPLINILWTSLIETIRHIGLNDVRLVRSSQVEGDRPSGRGVERVIKICEILGATRYVNPDGGRELYDQQIFNERGIDLQFLQPELVPYEQISGSAFVSRLSILDLLMHLGPEGTKAMCLLGTLTTR